MAGLKKFVFVLMPFEKPFSDIYTYGIKQTCNELNLYCERVDEQIYQERILDRIYNQIEKADIIVADMSTRNVNVFYEVGYAHGIGKNVILLTQKTDDIPFDLKHHPHIIYDGQIKDLSNMLKPRLDWFLNEETKEEIANFDFGLQFLINGEILETGKQIDLVSEDRDRYSDYYNLKIDIYNFSSKTHKSKFKIGIETEIESKSLFDGLEFIQPSKNIALFVSKDISNVYPSSFKSIEFKFLPPLANEYQVVKIPLKLKIFTSLEMKQIDFYISVRARVNDWL